ncbi:hypothetical protein CUJ84_Chr000527 [Rhizobium leguminosarum]|uniref:Uncharacterized protein n=1 Tax=Rhizobium leguminosarum TaxID=384 RepID=A0A2K9YY58_RHILE|nr:hypothetical protein CUJ84_Chr000527 [Rhizobium leguminosarum]
MDVSRNTVTLCDGHSRYTQTIANNADALRTALQPSKALPRSPCSGPPAAMRTS